MVGGKNVKGDAHERELVVAVDEGGWAVMRAPASGSATGRDLPDVLFGNGESFYAVEAKTSSGDPIYIEGSEIESLYYFAMNFGATARVAIRFNAKNGDPHWGSDEIEKWRFFDPEDLYKTDGGNYRIKKERTYEDGDRLSDL